MPRPRALSRRRAGEAIGSSPRSLVLSAFSYQFCRDVRTAQARAESAIDLVGEHGCSPLLGAHGTLVRGWALAEQEQAEEGIAHLRHALDVYQTLGYCNMRPYNLGLLAEALGKAGRPQEGLAALQEALATAHQTGERWYDAELRRLQGELTPQRPGSGVPSRQAEPEAEACFLKAIETARQQGAKLFELRAVMSLGRLRMRQGRPAEARSELAELYGWFTEGFDTRDLHEAQALLETLA